MLYNGKRPLMDVIDLSKPVSDCILKSVSFLAQKTWMVSISDVNTSVTVEA